MTVLAMDKRAAALERTLLRWRHRPFDWDGASCLHLLRAHARNMGHRNLPRVPRFYSAGGALRALRGTGHATLADLLTRHFQLLPAPAFAWVGDLVLVPGEDGRTAPLGAIGISDGAGNVWMWHDAAADGLRPVKELEAHIVAGWRL